MKVIASRFSYDSDRFIGGNSYIYFGTDTETQRHIVVKEVFDKSSRHKALLDRELEITPKVASRYTVKLLHNEYNSERNSCMLVMEKAEGGSLHDYLQARGPLPEAVARRWLAQLVQALRELWAQNYIHRDIKPANILLTTTDENAEIRLCDFGVSREIRGDVSMTNEVGTKDFIAPEVSDGRYTSAADIWSLGKVFYCMFNPSKTIASANLDCSRDSKDLIERMTAPREDRISGAELVRRTEQWLQSVNLPVSSSTLSVQVLALKNLLHFGGLQDSSFLLERGLQLETDLREWPQALKIQRTLNFYLILKVQALAPEKVLTIVKEIVETQHYCTNEEEIRGAMSAEFELPESELLERAKKWRENLRCYQVKVNDYVQTHLEEAVLWLGRSLQLCRVWDLTCEFALLILPEVPLRLEEYKRLQHSLAVRRDAACNGATILLIECPYQSLADCLEKEFSVSDSLSVLQQLTVCLSEVFSRGMSIPNIPECAFFTSSGVLKLAPFLPCSAAPKYSTAASDSWEQAAVWALGVLFCEMTSGRCFDAGSSVNVEEMISAGPGKAGAGFAALAARMLEVPSARISFSDLQEALSCRYRPFRAPLKTRTCQVTFEEDLYTARRLASKTIDSALFPGVDDLLADKKWQLTAELMDVAVAGTTCTLRYAYYEGGALADFMRERVFLEEAVRHWMRHLVREVQSVHRTTDMGECVHESHILMSEQSLSATLKFSDFRLRKAMTAALRTAVNKSNRGLFLPERVAVGLPSKKVDIWCLGRLFFKLIEGREPVPGVTQEFHRTSKHCQDLINSMLSLTDSQVTTEQCLAHSFFVEKPPLDIGAVKDSLPAAFQYAQRYLLEAFELFRNFLTRNEEKLAQVFSPFLSGVLHSIAGSEFVWSDLRDLPEQVWTELNDFEQRWKRADTDPIDQLLEFCQLTHTADARALARFACRAKPLHTEMTRTRFLAFLKVL